VSIVISSFKKIISETLETVKLNFALMILILWYGMVIQITEYYANPLSNMTSAL
jgi:hypothetical protein